MKQRLLATLVVTIIAAACGALGGSLLGRFITLRQTERRLIEDATRALTVADIRLTEAHAVLVAMKGSSYAPCSDAELTFFRALIFNGKYLKDAGRMSDGTIDCSGAMARPMQPPAQARQDITLSTGANLYKNLAPYKSEDQTVVTLQWEGFYTVFVPSIQAHIGPASEHYSEAVREGLNGQVDWLLGEPPPVAAKVFASDGFARVGDSLYATRCSSVFSNCITAYLSIPEALQADHIQCRIHMLLGGMTGAFLGFFCSLVYRRSRGMEQQLRRAIRRDKLRVEYQPIVSLTSKRIVGAEALARWTDEDGFEVGPDTFIKIAEERGFVEEVTKLVLRHVLSDFRETLRARPGFRVNINVTAADLGNPEFPLLVGRALAQAGVPAEGLGIEITESSTARRQVAVDAIHQLRKSGHCVYVDDFGTGYSSLAYLHALSIDSIKIDKFFTQAIGTEAVTVAILPQILAMAKALHLQVVVEGIETDQQADYFAGAERPVLAQGWLFGHAISAEEFYRLLTEDKEYPMDASTGL
ncbi:MAG: EAL domain-containing protein [Terracidiphilus sp.]